MQVTAQCLSCGTLFSLAASIAAVPCHHAMLALPADGIRSCCGSERIFVFTSNHPERLDPALIRPGRMDLHIALGYCTGELLCCRARPAATATLRPLLNAGPGGMPAASILAC